MFAGAAARRLSLQASSKAVFPFTVDNSAAGYGTSADSEYGDSSRAEFWAPLWGLPRLNCELCIFGYVGEFPYRAVPSAADRPNFGHSRPPKSEGRRTHP